MEGRVPLLSILFMLLSLLVGFGLPVGMLLYLRIKKKADMLPFFIGCAVMVLFAFVLEQQFHRLVLGSGAGDMIRNTPLLYALYGGLCAGLFEETGRFCAFRFTLRKYQDRDVNALMYGAGHGGIEAAMILGIAMINNIIFSVLWNTGNAGALTARLEGSALAQIEAAFNTLLTTPSFHFLLGACERVFAVALHLALSVLVWFAAKSRNKRYLYPLAVFLHFLVDAVTAYLAAIGTPLLATEAAVGVLSLAACLIARQVWKKYADSC